MLPAWQPDAIASPRSPAFWFAKPIRLKLRLLKDERLKLLKLQPLSLERQSPLALAALPHQSSLESLSARLAG